MMKGLETTLLEPNISPQSKISLKVEFLLTKYSTPNCAIWCTKAKDFIALKNSTEENCTTLASKAREQGPPSFMISCCSLSHHLLTFLISLFPFP